MPAGGTGKCYEWNSMPPNPYVEMLLGDRDSKRQLTLNEVISVGPRYG